MRGDKMKKIGLYFASLMGMLKVASAEFTIPGPYKSPASSTNFVAILAGILLIIAIIVLLYFNFRKKKPKNAPKRK